MVVLTVENLTIENFDLDSWVGFGCGDVVVALWICLDRNSITRFIEALDTAAGHPQIEIFYGQSVGYIT